MLLDCERGDSQIEWEGDGMNEVWKHSQTNGVLQEVTDGNH